MQKSSGLIIVIGLIGLLSSCRSTKRIQTVMSKKDTTQVTANRQADSKADSIRFIQQVYGTIQRNKISFNTFSAKVKVNFEGNDGKKSDFNAFLRLKKDSALWISINAALGIEAFRIMITRDSVKVLNKLEKIAQLRSLGYLQEVAKIPLSFTELQNLIVGNAPYLDSNIVSYKNEEASVSLVSLGDLFKHFLTVSKNEFQLQHSKLDDVDKIRARTCDITYGDYETKNGVSFSTFRKITVSEKAKLDIEMQFKQFDFNEQLNFPFNIPRNYKVQ
ncbi:MAG: DUF4292 domain-containing protein [Chitinophagaceae bacterium]|nr:DUF4292 domain-containing protein [Chitinophagaceae bacterium]